MTNTSHTKKVLVLEEVEDDVSLHNILHKKFVNEGFSVLGARDGEEGLAIALQEHPDLIVLDIVMPKMDGITMMKKIRRANEWGKQVPIILLTNLSADNETLTRVITENKPVYHLVKSDWTLDDLVKKIREWAPHP